MRDFPVVIGGRWSVIEWSPFGIPGTPGAAAIPVGIVYGRKDGACGMGWVDPAALIPAEDALNAKQRMGELDWLIVQAIAEARYTPQQAADRFPGTQRTCYQIWRVTESHPVVLPVDRAVRDALTGLWRRSGGLPLANIREWTA